MKNNVSLFSQTLRKLLEDTNRFNREGWCRFLGISSAAISQWLSDHTIPRAEVLRTILDELERTRRSKQVNADPLDEFRRICDLPAADLTPNHERFGPTIGHYVLSPLLENYENMLDTLPMAHQEIVLNDGLDRIRQALRLGAAFTGSSRASDLIKRYPAGTKLYEHDLVPFFGSQQWDRVVVLGLDPLELANQEVVRPVSRKLLHVLVRSQQASVPSPVDRRFVYVLPTDSSGRVVQSLQDFFWGTNVPDPQTIDMKPYLLQLAEWDVRRLLTVGNTAGQTPSLIVAFYIGRSASIAYSWFVRGPEEHGVMLSPDQVRTLANQFGDLNIDSSAKEVSDVAA